MNINSKENDFKGCKRPEDMLYKLSTPKEVISNYDGCEYDKQASFMLNLMLEKQYQYSEDTQQIEFKKQLVENLRKIVQQWVIDIALTSDISKDMISQVGGDLKVFGSFALDVNSQESDIDTVCIVPKFVRIEDHFFKKLVAILNDTPGITDLFSISEALVPLIRLKYKGISFDILFSRLDSNYIKDNIDWDSNKILINMDEKSYRSFNGYRVAQYLKKQIVNYENFQNTLKIVKLWAKNRGIYSNIIGYLSGIGWTILVAKICQLYPYSPVNILLEKFFFIFSQWKWQDQPIIIEEIKSDHQNPRLSADQWQNEQQWKNLMMIITPCFPCMNTAHNVSIITLRIIQKQFKNAYKIITEIKNITKNQQQQPNIPIENRKEGLKKLLESYKQLLKKTSFFVHYNQFLKISVMAKNQLDFNVWEGHVESKLRKLTKMFESMPYSNLEVHPYPYVLETKNEDYPFSCCYLYGIRCFQDPKSMDDNMIIDLRDPSLLFIEHVEKSFSEKQVPISMNMKIEHVVRDDIIDIIKQHRKKTKIYSSINNDEFLENLLIEYNKSQQSSKQHYTQEIYTQNENENENENENKNNLQVNDQNLTQPQD